MILNDNPPSPADHWYAFVESQDPFRGSIAGAGDGDWWGHVLISRQKSELPAPSRIVWLSCIKASYFEDLTWRSEPCEIGDEEQSERRRAQLLDLNESQLLVVPLLLCWGEREEFAIFASLGRHDWHRIRLEHNARYPVWTAPDFALENNGIPNRLDYLGSCTEPEREALRAVFNLNFLQDEDMGGEEERGPLPPTLAPEPGKDLRQRPSKYYSQQEDRFERRAS